MWKKLKKKLPQFNEMIEIIHFVLVNNVPLILEGMPGKKLCINYWTPRIWSS